MKKVLFIAPLIVFLGLVAYFALGLTRDPAAIPSVLIDKPVPTFDLPAVSNAHASLATTDLKGQVALVNVFASWCVACHIEHPTLMRLRDRNDFLLVGINWKDKPGAGATWLARHGDPYARTGDDADGRIAIEFGVTGAPETFIVDREGRIRYRYAGAITDAIWENEIEPIVKRLQ